MVSFSTSKSTFKGSDIYIGAAVPNWPVRLQAFFEVILTPKASIPYL